MVDVKTKTFLYSTINITTEKYCSVAFICLATRHHFIHRFKKVELPCTAEKYRTARECCSVAFIFNCHTCVLSARNEEVRTIVFSIIISNPHSSNFRKNGYQLWVQCFVGSFAWINVSYHWSMVSKATVNQLQVTLVQLNQNPRNHCAESLYPFPLFLKWGINICSNFPLCWRKQRRESDPRPAWMRTLHSTAANWLSMIPKVRKNTRKVHDFESWFIQ